MHPEDGPSLPLDGQLRLPHHFPPLHPLCLLCGRQYVDTRLPPFQTCPRYMG